MTQLASHEKQDPGAFGDRFPRYRQPWSAPRQLPVNADGTDITGVSFPVKVLTPWALENAKQVTDADSYDITVTLKGKESTTTYTGADALFENESYAYYKLSETPAYYITAWYNLLSGKWEFGKVHATEATTAS